MTTKLYIKNMVCPRCIVTVKTIFETLEIPVADVQLGEVSLLTEPSESQKTKIEEELLKNGFELLLDHKSKIISQVKTIVVNQIHHVSDPLKVNFSVLLSESLNHEYTGLSKLFSQVEGMTIERFIVKQKIEKVKELLFYDQLTLSEIADQLDYSSTAHLSSQFKKETGMTPSEFKKIRKPSHQSLDSI